MGYNVLRSGFVFLLISIFSVAYAAVDEAKQEKPKQAEQKAEQKKEQEADEQAGEEPPKLEEVVQRSFHLPQLLEMPEAPPESSPAHLGELREEKEQLEKIIKQDTQTVQAIREGFKEQAALPPNEWKEAYVASKEEELKVQQRIARNLESLEKVKNELTFLTGAL